MARPTAFADTFLVHLGRALPLGVVLLISLLAAACSDSPTAPTETFVYTGTVDYRGSTEQVLDLSDRETIRVTASVLRPILVEISPGTVFVPTIGIAFSDTNDDGGCQSQAQRILKQGQSQLFSVNKNTCMNVLDSGSLREGGSLYFEIIIEVVS